MKLETPMYVKMDKQFTQKEEELSQEKYKNALAKIKESRTSMNVKSQSIFERKSSNSSNTTSPYKKYYRNPIFYLNQNVSKSVEVDQQRNKARRKKMQAIMKNYARGRSKQNIFLIQG